MSSITDILNSSVKTTATADSSKSTAASSTATTKKTTDIMGKEDFLALLVAQLKNQNPLNPDNPTEFTAQLAQFSSLEQLTNLNTNMNNVLTATNNVTKMSALDMIGKQISFAGSTFTYNGASVQLGYTLDGQASQVQLAIQDTNGKVIQTLNGKDLTKGDHTLTWNGQDANGNAVQPGTYKVAVTAKGVDNTGVAASPIIRSEVTGVDLNNAGNPIMSTKAGDIDFSKILEVFSSSIL